MKKTLVLFFSFSYLLVFILQAQDRTPAFPTAEGYGKWTTGGRGGKVVTVTNLEDDKNNPPEGSFRWALKQFNGEPITIIFKVSGTIDLKGNDLRSKRSNITIAGQTAPGDGICIKGGNLNFGGSRNIIVRHIRSRVGLTDDGGFIAGACMSLENGGQFIIDHCSFSWSAEENIGFYDNDSTTVQWCLIAEGLYDAGHGKGRRGYGAVVGGKTATYHHNLIAHNVSRAPRFGATTKNDPVMLLDYVNNVHYNWGKSNSFYGGDNRQGTKGKFQANIVNNYYKPGPAYPGTSKTRIVRASFWTDAPVQGRNESLWHLNGNYIEGTANSAINTNNYSGVDFDDYKNTFSDITIDDLKSEHFQVPYPVITESVNDAYQSVLLKAGAFPRDTIDRRIIDETITGTAVASSSFNGNKVTGIVDRPEDSGGFANYNSYNFVLDSDGDGIPDYWEKENGIDPMNSEDRNMMSPQGYTYLEVYLNGLVGEYLPGYNYPDPEYITSIEETPYQNKVSIYLDSDGNTLKIKSTEIITAISLYDSLGKLILSHSGNSFSEIDITALPKGVYIVLLKTENNTLQKLKFIKY